MVTGFAFIALYMSRFTDVRALFNRNELAEAQVELVHPLAVDRAGIHDRHRRVRRAARQRPAE